MKNIFKSFRFYFLGFSAIIFCVSAMNLDTGNKKLPKTSAELGEILFNETLLSSNNAVSCASCHKPEFAFADNEIKSRGVNGLTRRNTPTATYMNGRLHYFWDARAKTLEHQASGPITDRMEMNMPIAGVIKRLNDSKFYTDAFQAVYKSKPDSVLLLKAIADFQRTLSSYNSAYDRFIAGDDKALSPAQIRGYYLFFQENTCAVRSCHGGKDFTHDEMVANGLSDLNDKGLSELSKLRVDEGKFKTPTLRNVALTAPYMHDGSKETLKDVLRFYNDERNFNVTNKQKIHHRVQHQRTQPLTESEMDDMVEFLKSLTDEQYLKYLTEKK